jgi:hypothetical protein
MLRSEFRALSSRIPAQGVKSPYSRQRSKTVAETAPQETRVSLRGIDLADILALIHASLWDAVRALGTDTRQ